MKENVNHPSHYNKGIEAIAYIDSHGMNFTEGNVIKYVTRYKDKNGLEDLKKAKWYLDHLIEQYQKQLEETSRLKGVNHVKVNRL